MTSLFSEILELDRQIAELQARREVYLQQKRDEALSTARDLVARFSLTPAQLQLGSSAQAVRASKVSRPITFSDPIRGLSWDGDIQARGRKPAWIQAAIDNGSIEEYRVASKPAAAAAPAAPSRPVERPKSKAERARELGLVY